MPSICHVELQRVVNIAKGMMPHLVLYDLGSTGMCSIAKHIFLFMSRAAVLKLVSMSYDDHGKGHYSNG